MRNTIFIFRVLLYALLLPVTVGFQPAMAEDDKSGVKPQVISLPAGPGTIEGLGESFEPRLNAGTAAYAVPLAVPQGTNGHQPAVSLVYEGGKGNGAFGIGWDVPIMYIQRQMDRGLPAYIDSNDGLDNDHDGGVDEPDEKDVFIFSNGEELVPLDNGDYRCENEQEFIRFRRTGGGWTGTRPDGTFITFGTTVDARVQDGAKIFRWYVQEVKDTNGNLILHKYAKYPDSPGMVYCREIRYALRHSDATVFHSVVFSYENRSDQFSDFRSTFQVTSGRRCSKIEMITQGANLQRSEYADHNDDFTMDSLVRRYMLSYKEGADFSLLSKITQTASDGVNSLPPIMFDYTEFQENSGSVIYMENPPPYGVADGDTDLFDANADGLPDLFHTAGSYHFYYENKGNGQWADALSVMEGGPGSTTLLSSPGTHLSDINGDGKTDLVVKAGAQSFRYYLSTGQGGYEDGRTMLFLGQIPTFPFDGNSNVRLLDIDFDKDIDLMLTTSSQYIYWYNLGDGRFSDSIYGPVALINPYFAFKFDNTRARLADMNGDRLQDLVLVQSGAVCYFPNMGCGAWGGKMDMAGSPVVGFRDEFLLIEDINSDGLYDLVLENTGRAGEIDYWINKGNNGFTERRTIAGLPGSISNTAIRMADMNGNGTSDILWNSPFAPENMKYRYLDLSAGIQPNLLKSIDNGLGRKISIRYRSSTDSYVEARDSGNPWSTKVPFPVSIVSGMTVTTGLDLDGVSGRDAYETNYTYRDGCYDGVEKEFRGFAWAKKSEVGDLTAPTLVTQYDFHTGGPDGQDNDGDGETDERGLDMSLEAEPLKGKVIRSEITSEAGVVYHRNLNSWKIKTLLTGSDGREVRFAYNHEKNTDIVEGTNDPISLKTTYLYDDYGNTTEEKNYGALSVTGDEIFTYNEYINDTERWILDRPKRQLQTNAIGARVNEITSYYDGEPYVGLALGSIEKGNLTRQKSWVAESAYVNALRNAFDAWGNIVGTKDGNGNLREFEYDGLFYTFPVKETIHVGRGNPPLTFQADYDVGLGVVTRSTDFNGNTTHYNYDSFGRLVTIVRPGDSPVFPTQSFTYTMVDPERGLIYTYDEDGGLTLTAGTAFANSVMTRTREHFGLPGTLDSIQYSDGLGRKLAVVEEAEQGFIVKESVLFNERGSKRFTFLPYSASSWDYEFPPSNQPKTETHYDSAGREIYRINPPDQAGTISSARFEYKPLERTETDENGNFKTFINDGLERLIEVHEKNGDEIYTARYEYTPLGDLTKITDAQNNIKSIAYDGLKRKTIMDDPDRGLMVYEYDDASNLIKTTDNKGQVVLYTYDGANRILTEDYLDAAGRTPDVAYHYDGISKDYPDAVNLKGTLSWIEDLSGGQFFSYDSRGNPLWAIKRIQVGEAFSDYKTAFVHDAMGRVISMTYPDGDRIQYVYNDRALLDSIPGLVKSIDYRASGQLDSINYANGVETRYEYDPRQRLMRLGTISKSRGNEALQDLNYILDGVSNITDIADGRILPPDSPKSATQSFQYDDVYRLTKAEGPGYGAINFSYDKIGNMTWKKSPDAPDPNHIEDALVNLGGMGYGGTEGSSNRSGKAPGDPPGPHAVTSTESGLQYAYDDNGNMMLHEGTDIYSWDFKDRLVRVQKGGADIQYVYDHAGQRIMKKVKDGSGEKSTFYISDAYEIREDRQLKYVFAGDRRVAQIEGKLPSPDGPSIQVLIFQPGWNFFSLEVEPENPAVETVLSPIEGGFNEIWTYDTSDSQYRGFFPSDGIHDLAELHAQKGYLIKVITPVTLILKGTKILNDVSLNPGWNLIGFPTNTDIPIEEALASIEEKVSSVCCYDETTTKWKRFDPRAPVFLNDLKKIEPGKAYWVEMKADALLTSINKPTEKVHFYHPDHLGSSNVITDSEGSVVESTEYYPYGRPRYEERLGFNSVYKYTGKELDKESGLMYYEARYYDAVVARFLSVDPLAYEFNEKRESLIKRQNTYTYCMSNPVRFIDPDGRDSIQYDYSDKYGFSAEALGFGYGVMGGFKRNESENINSEYFELQWALLGSEFEWGSVKGENFKKLTVQFSIFSGSIGFGKAYAGKNWIDRTEFDVAFSFDYTFLRHLYSNEIGISITEKGNIEHYGSISILGLKMEKLVEPVKNWDKEDSNFEVWNRSSTATGFYRELKSETKPPEYLKFDPSSFEKTQNSGYPSLK